MLKCRFFDDIKLANQLSLFFKYRYVMALLLASALLLSSCSTSKNSYPYKKKRKKRKCDCPEWSFKNNPSSKTETLLLS